MKQWLLIPPTEGELDDALQDAWCIHKRCVYRNEHRCAWVAQHGDVQMVFEDIDHEPTYPYSILAIYRANTEMKVCNALLEEITYLPSEGA